jgi:hypothetical protein
MKILIYRGTSGAGKTTHAMKTTGEILLAADEDKQPTIKYCSADDYFVDQETGKYEFDPTKLGNAHAECYDKFLSAIADQADYIIVDNTFCQLWELSPYLVHAKSKGISVHMYQFDAYAETRVEKNVHGLCEDAVNNQILEKIPDFIIVQYCASLSKFWNYQFKRTIYWDATFKPITFHDFDKEYSRAGQVCLEIDSTDCDHCQSVTQHLVELDDLGKYMRSVYDGAEGPTHIDFKHPDYMLTATEYRKDHIAEAHENGHPYSVGG